MEAIRRFTVRAVLPPELQVLDTLARNLRWCWHHPTYEFFESLDPEAWERADGDPVALLGEISPKRIGELAEDPQIMGEAERLSAELQDYLTSAQWYQDFLPEGQASSPVAYFSAEFGITEALPQYSGGLGVLAGDHLKSASDLGVPMIAVGLLYRAGYFRQSLTLDGRQKESYPLLDPNDLPLSPLRDAEGKRVLISLDLPEGRVLYAQIWEAPIGRVPLLLLDSNIPENDERGRAVTDRLDGPSAQHRLQQQLLLGAGGIRALREYTRLTGFPTPAVYHCNEAHAGFLALERLHETVDEGATDFETALEAVRAGTLFTSHTPTFGGFDRFDKSVVRSHLSALDFQGIDVEDMLSLGAERSFDGEPYPGANSHVFNMALLGLRTARMVNGVGQLHGRVSRRIFSRLWPGFDVGDVPITSVTNGVHGPTWRNPKFARLLEFQESVPPSVTNSAIWEERERLRERLVKEARRRMRESWLERGASPAEVTWTDSVLDPKVLTIGFARRVPAYKRLTLILSDEDRLRRLLMHPTHPVQFVIAGKSNPDDDQALDLIQRLVKFSDDPRVRDRLLFLPDYDMGLARILVPGCDVWLNNPLRPLEASGTSGMKCALNGALNLSILDGWWDEMYDGKNGWAIPTADGVTDPARRDQIEAAALYDLIENEVAPLFYDRDIRGLPSHWMTMVRHSLNTLGPKVQATRMVRSYVEELYVPLAQAAQVLAEPPFAEAQKLAQWKKKVQDSWPEVSIELTEAALSDVIELGDTVHVVAEVKLGALSPEDVEVQMVSGRVDANDKITEGIVTPLSPTSYVSQAGSERTWIYQGSRVLEVSGAVGFGLRVLPTNPLMACDAELGLIANATVKA